MITGWMPTGFYSEWFSEWFPLFGEGGLKEFVNKNSNITMEFAGNSMVTKIVNKNSIIDKQVDLDSEFNLGAG